MTGSIGDGRRRPLAPARDAGRHPSPVPVHHAHLGRLPPPRKVGDVVGLPYDQGESLSLVVGDQHHLDVLPTTSGKRLACVVVDHEENQ